MLGSVPLRWYHHVLFAEVKEDYRWYIRTFGAKIDIADFVNLYTARLADSRIHIAQSRAHQGYVYLTGRSDASADDTKRLFGVLGA